MPQGPLHKVLISSSNCSFPRGPWSVIVARYCQSLCLGGHWLSDAYTPLWEMASRRSPPQPVER
jgi:hypothetical protein